MFKENYIDIHRFKYAEVIRIGCTYKKLFFERFI